MEIYEIKSKEQYGEMKRNAIITQEKLNEDGEYAYKNNLSNVKPINGKDLFYSCAALGFGIRNYQMVKFDKNYYLEFLGFCEFFAVDNIDEIKRKIEMENQKQNEFKEMWKNMSDAERTKWINECEF